MRCCRCRSRAIGRRHSCRRSRSITAPTRTWCRHCALAISTCRVFSHCMRVRDLAAGSVATPPVNRMTDAGLGRRLQVLVQAWKEQNYAAWRDAESAGPSPVADHVSDVAPDEAADGVARIRKRAARLAGPAAARIARTKRCRKHSTPRSAAAEEAALPLLRDVLITRARDIGLARPAVTSTREDVADGSPRGCRSTCGAAAPADHPDSSRRSRRAGPRVRAARRADRSAPIRPRAGTCSPARRARCRPRRSATSPRSGVAPQLRQLARRDDHLSLSRDTAAARPADRQDDGIRRDRRDSGRRLSPARRRSRPERSPSLLDQCGRDRAISSALVSSRKDHRCRTAGAWC